MVLLHFRLGSAGSRLPSDLGDPVLILYFMEWGGKFLARGLRGYREFWNAGFYFPSKEVMTLSDHVIGPAIQASLLHRLGVNEVGGYNFLFLSSFVLCGLTTTWVLRRAGVGLPAAILAGIMFAFSPYRSDQRAHLQVLLMQWIPLMLWLWHRLLEETTPRRAAAFAIVYASTSPAGCTSPISSTSRSPSCCSSTSIVGGSSPHGARCAYWCPPSLSAAPWRPRSSLLTSSPAAATTSNAASGKPATGVRLS